MTGALRLVLVAAIGMLGFAAGTAGAADSADPWQCKPDGLQQEMNACAVRDFRAADAKLNIRYVAVMEALSTDQRVALRTEQREWLKRRDPRCKAEARASEGGSIWPLAFYGCLEKATADRVKVINGWEGRR